MDLVIPDDLKPADGRFGSGPSKVRPAAIEALSRVTTSFLGTSHRRSRYATRSPGCAAGSASSSGCPTGTR